MVKRGVVSPIKPEEREGTTDSLNKRVELTDKAILILEQLAYQNQSLTPILGREAEQTN